MCSQGSMSEVLYEKLRCGTVQAIESEKVEMSCNFDLEDFLASRRMDDTLAMIKSRDG